MTIWTVKPINEAPEIELEQWQIIEARSPYWDGVTRHFVGYNITDCEGRVSSAITQFDETKMQGITRSGRVYKLVGKPNWNKDAEYVWCRWCSINHVEDQQNITKEFTDGQKS
jgi:hypothetical protein